MLRGRTICVCLADPGDISSVEPECCCCWNCRASCRSSACASAGVGHGRGLCTRLCTCACVAGVLVGGRGWELQRPGGPAMRVARLSCAGPCSVIHMRVSAGRDRKPTSRSQARQCPAGWVCAAGSVCASQAPSTKAEFDTWRYACKRNDEGCAHVCIKNTFGLNCLAEHTQAYNAQVKCPFSNHFTHAMHISLHPHTHPSDPLEACTYAGTRTRPPFSHT